MTLEMNLNIAERSAKRCLPFYRYFARRDIALKIRDYANNVSDKDYVRDLLSIITSVAEVGSITLVEKTIELLGEYDEMTARSVGYSFTGLCITAEQDDILPVIDLLQECTSAEMARNIGHCASRVVSFTYDSLLLRELLQLIKDNPSNQMIKGIAEVAKRARNNHLIRQYIGVCRDLVECPPYVLQELGDLFISNVEERGTLTLNRIYDSQIIDQEMTDRLSNIIGNEKDFLLKQDHSTLAPLIHIFTKVDERYYPCIKFLCEHEKHDLARAYSIAKSNRNEDTKSTYLPDFYDGLKDCLEERPEMLGRWAASICSDFRKRGETGLLRGVAQ